MFGRNHRMPRMRAKAGGETAASLVEFMVALAVGVLLLGATGALYVQTSKGFLAQLNYVDLDNQSRLALDQMSQQIRMAQTVTSCSATNLVFVDRDTNTLSYTYNPTLKTLARTKNGVTRTLLTGCDSLSFSMFQRTPNGGNAEFYATTNPGECKLVQMTWTCSRQILGVTANTETMQTTKVMLRNK